MSTSPFDLLPPLSEEDYEALKADIAARGVQVPVEYDEHGNILDGHHRVRACQELGIKDWPRIVRVGLSEEEKIEHALALNFVRRHLSREQRQELVARLRQRGLSLRRIAELLGVHHDTIREDLSGVGNPTPENPPEATGADGKTYPARQRTEAERQALAERAQALRSEGATFPEIAERAGVARPVQFGFRGTERLVASRSRRGRLRCRCVAGGRGLDLQLAAHFSLRGLIETSSYGKAPSGRTTTRQPQSGGPRP